MRRELYCANPSLLPKHALARYPNINNVPYNSLPVGIRPFKFQRWDRSKQVVLVANPLYWRGRPKLDKIVYKIIPDRDKLLSQLEVHRVDMWQGGVVYGDKWDVIYFTWAADTLGDYSGIYGCHSFPPAGQNNLRWCNKTAQAAMDALLGHYEQSQRTADTKVVMQEFVKDVPSIVSSLRVNMFAYNKDLKNYHPNNVTPFDNMMDVDI